MAIINYDKEIVINVDEVHKEIAELEEEDLEIVGEVRLTVIYKDMTFKVYAYHIEDDADMYSVIVYDNEGNELSQSYLDSTGGASFIEEEIRIFDKNYNRLTVVEEGIMDALFGKVKPLIMPF